MTLRNCTVSFSGHRIIRPPAPDLFGISSPNASSEEFYRIISERVDKAIRIMIEKGRIRFICGMAEGFDLLAGRAVLRTKRDFPQTRLICAVPFPGQARGYSERGKELYERILQEADERYILSKGYKPDCFHRRNDFMVDNSSALICWYDGTPGGTSYTVKEALRKGLSVCNLYNNPVL